MTPKALNDIQSEAKDLGLCNKARDSSADFGTTHGGTGPDAAFENRKRGWRLSVPDVFPVSAFGGTVDGERGPKLAQRFLRSGLERRAMQNGVGKVGDLRSE